MKTFFRMLIHFSLLVLLVVSFMGGLSFDPAEAEDYIYWTTITTDLVGRVKLDGSSAETLIGAGLNNPYGVFAQGDYIYWTDYDNYRIGRAKVDGSDQEPNFIILGANRRPVGICADANYLYWTDHDKLIARNDSIGRANLDGTGDDKDWITLPYKQDAIGICVNSEFIYWATDAQDRIARANLDGTGKDENFITTGNDPYGVAANADYIYWTNHTDETIGRANLDGTGVTEPWITSVGIKPCFLTLNSQYIYWANDTDDTISKATLAGGTPETVYNTGAGSGPFGCALLAAASFGNPSSCKATVTKVEMHDGTSWVTLFSGTAQLDMVAGGTFPGIDNLILPGGTYSQIRVTFKNSFPVSGTLSYGGTTYYTTATTFEGQTNLRSTATTVAGSMAEFTFRIEDWGALDADATQTNDITPVTVDSSTDYQLTLRFTISDKLMLEGTGGTYYFTFAEPTVSIVEP